MTIEGAGGGYDALAEARRLLRGQRSGTLATLAPDGAPFASLVAVATMPDGAPILLVSRLAAHTHNLERNGRCSLLLAQRGKGDPLAHPRLTLVGEAVPADVRTEDARRRFLARNPKSALYADFPDFAFWIVAVEAAHLNGGFARAARFTGNELILNGDESAEAIAAEAGAVAHMNTDHRDAVALYATRLAGLTDGDWTISGLDPEGVDMICGDNTGRVRFAERATTRADLRRLLVGLVDAANRTSP